MVFVVEAVVVTALACKASKDGDTMTTYSGGPSVRLSTEHALMPTFVTSDTLEQIIIKDFSSLSGVTSVKVEHENGEVLVWIGMHNPPRDLRYKVYDRQAALIEAFPEVDINFNLISA